MDIDNESTLQEYQIQLEQVKHASYYFGTTYLLSLSCVLKNKRLN